jgi:phenylacetate-CoA ligase
MAYKKIKSWFIENVFLKIGDILQGTCTISYLKQQRKITHLSKDELKSLQTSKLQLILEHATKTCNAYKPFNGIYSSPEAWLKTFPILTKKDTATSQLNYVSSSFDISKLIKYESSGSTGQRSVIYIDKKEQALIRAILILWWEWNGYYFGRPILQTGMSPKRGLVKKVKDFLLSTEYMVAFNLDEHVILEKLDKVKKKKNMFLFGYASSLYEISKTARKYNVSNTFDLAMSQGDKLFNHYKLEIETAFNCQVVEDYGLNEGFMVGQKVDLPYYYIYTPSVYIEILNERGESVPDGEMGRIVLTKLDGYAMPLIRYDTGDLGVMLPKEEYPLNRKYSFPLLQMVIGRNTDIIKTRDGKSLIVHTFTGIFEFYSEIEQFQVVQNVEDEIQINYITTDSFKKTVLSKIENEFRNKTKTNIAINWNQVDHIEPSASGKPQIIINNLIKNSLSSVE